MVRSPCSKPGDLDSKIPNQFQSIGQVKISFYYIIASQIKQCFAAHVQPFDFEVIIVFVGTTICFHNFRELCACADEIKTSTLHALSIETLMSEYIMTGDAPSVCYASYKVNTELQSALSHCVSQRISQRQFCFNRTPYGNKQVYR